MERTRVIPYAGRGGVGKTTIAAYTACGWAKLSYKTIVLSTDAALSLVDSFDISLGNKTQPIAPKLRAQETNISQTLSTYWSIIQKWLAHLSHVLGCCTGK